MKTIEIPKADRLHRINEIESVTIIIDKEIKADLKISLKDMEYKFDAIAEKLSTALLSSLPQGVIEPLIIKLMQAKISLYHGTIKR